MRLGVGEAFIIMLPNTFFFQTPEESLDESVLLWCIRRDELLGQPICAACLSEPLTLEYKPIVTSDNRCPSPDVARHEAGERMYIEWHIKEVFHSPSRYLQSA